MIIIQFIVFALMAILAWKFWEQFDKELNEFLKDKIEDEEYRQLVVYIVIVFISAFFILSVIYLGN